VHLVGFIIRIYHDARSPERQKMFEWLASRSGYYNPGESVARYLLNRGYAGRCGLSQKELSVLGINPWFLCHTILSSNIWQFSSMSTACLLLSCFDILKSSESLYSLRQFNMIHTRIYSNIILQCTPDFSSYSFNMRFWTSIFLFVPWLSRSLRNFTSIITDILSFSVHCLLSPSFNLQLP